MKAFLVVPPTGRYIREDRCQTPIDELFTVAPRPPMDLLYMAACLQREGVTCRIMDCPVEEKNWDDLTEVAKEFIPDLLFLSITTPTLAQDLRAATLVKELNPAAVTVTKGAHFTFKAKAALEQFPQLDVVIRGEYELAAAELVQPGKQMSEIAGIAYRQNGEIKENPDRPFLDELDRLPFPARELIKNELYQRPDLGVPQTTIITSRGCPFKCTFCLSRVVAGSRLRVRSPENVLAEVRECVEKFGIRDFLFRSDTFTANHDWLRELCRRLKESGLGVRWACNSRVNTITAELMREMREAGCWLIAFGVESGSEELLQRVKKGITKADVRRALSECRRAGVKSSIYFLLGLPWETEQTFQETVNFACELNPDFLEFFYVYPFEGTELYEVAVEKGLLARGEYPIASYSAPAMPSIYLSMAQLAGMRRRALRSFYLRPSYIWRTLRQAGSWDVIRNYLRYGWRQLQDLLFHVKH